MTTRSTSCGRAFGQRGDDRAAQRVSDRLDVPGTCSLASACATRSAWFGDRVAGCRLFGAAVAEHVDRDHPVRALEPRHHPVPPVDRAAEAVDEQDRRRVAGPSFDDLDVAAAELQDATAGLVDFGALRFALGDQRVDAEQHAPGRPGCRSRSSIPVPLRQYPSRNMEKFVIEGGVPLSGELTPAGNKNAALPILAACLLTEEELLLHRLPRIRDTEAQIALLERLGVEAEWVGDNSLRLCAAAGFGRRRGRGALEADPRLVPARRPAAGPLRRGAHAAARAATSSAGAGSTPTSTPSPTSAPRSTGAAGSS